MKCVAELTTESKDVESVARALNVDNVQLRGIETVVSGGSIKTVVSSDKISTLLSTLDDIICCQMVAESTIQNGR